QPATCSINPECGEEWRKGKLAARKKGPFLVVGAGPAGLTAAHFLSLCGYRLTIVEADAYPGGMLLSCIPPYRLPREVIQKEIAALLDKNMTLRLGTRFGSDCDIDSLFAEGHQAVFLALGAHRSRRMGIPGEEGTVGVYPSVEFLKSFNLRSEMKARGRVTVIGGGNSAVDAARVALRQDGVESVTIYYRRTRDEMPALEEEVAAALHEGVKLETLVAPLRILARNGRVSEVEMIRNRLGETDASGRRAPVPIPKSEFRIRTDTVIVAISEEPDTDINYLKSMGIEVSPNGTIRADPVTLMTGRRGVFAGGDVVTGPSFVVDAIAAGKRAAVMIDHFLRNEPLAEPKGIRLPDVYVPVPDGEDEFARLPRAEPPRLPAELTRRSFAEVELSLSVAEATMESRRCLRCDLEFTKPKVESAAAAGGRVA
ncbi:MAG: FAD-dependent oxidoreductase, partial [candidate division WOR-3 bacterium]